MADGTEELSSDHRVPGDTLWVDHPQIPLTETGDLVRESAGYQQIKTVGCCNPWKRPLSSSGRLLVEIMIMNETRAARTGGGIPKYN